MSPARLAKPCLLMMQRALVGVDISSRGARMSAYAKASVPGAHADALDDAAHLAETLRRGRLRIRDHHAVYA